MSTVSLILTILGKDRPGLVDALAQAVAEQGGNWVESQMAHLAGQFAGILRVEVSEEQAEGLKAALRALDDLQLELVVQSNGQAEGPQEQPSVRLDLVGQDRPGLVREITQVLAAAEVNVEQFTTKRTSAPNSGQSLFLATAVLHIPAAASQADLRESLEQLAADLMVEITLQ